MHLHKSGSDHGFWDYSKHSVWQVILDSVGVLTLKLCDGETADLSQTNNKQTNKAIGTKKFEMINAIQRFKV